MRLDKSRILIPFRFKFSEEQKTRLVSTHDLKTYDSAPLDWSK